MAYFLEMLEKMGLIGSDGSGLMLYSMEGLLSLLAVALRVLDTIIALFGNSQSDSVWLKLKMEFILPNSNQYTVTQ